MEEQEIILEVENDKEQEISILEEEIKEIKPNYEQLQITPSIEEQVFKGSFDKVTVEAIEDLTEEITNQGELITEQETTIEDVMEALKDKAGLNIKLQEKTVMPNTEEQEITSDEGYFGLSKVTVSGDENLVAENIKEGTSIFGVEGNVKSTNARITDCTELFYQGRRTDYMYELLKLCDKSSGAKNMFQYAFDLTSLDLSNLDTSNFDTMWNMFGNCTNLTSVDLSNFNTSNVTNMSSLFNSDKNLISIDLSSFDTSKVTDMNSMFSQCENLESVNLSSFDTSNVTRMNDMFRRCDNLTELDLSNFDMSKVIDIDSMLGYIYNMPVLKSFRNLGKGYTEQTVNYSKYSLNLSTLRELTKESLLDVINNGLYDLNLTYDVANGGTLYTQNLKLHSSSKSKLTADEIAIATNKGWTVS